MQEKECLVTGYLDHQENCRENKNKGGSFPGSGWFKWLASEAETGTNRTPDAEAVMALVMMEVAS